MFGLILKNAKILDGNLNPEFRGDIGIKDGKIKSIGKLDLFEATNVIDCSNYYVTPGFIDSHAHDDFTYGNEYSELGKISQGITSTVVGQCGFSLFPTNPDTVKLLKKKLLAFGINVDTNKLVKYLSYKSYVDAITQKGCRINYRHFIGHSTIRTAVMGDVKRKPTYAEICKMKEYIHEAMTSGAGGMSAGLIYTPGAFAETDELVELLKTVAKYGGIYAVHMRNESDDVVNAVKESIGIAKSAGVPLRISHHKIAGRQNRSKSDETLAIIQTGIDEGVDIMVDAYPYDSAASFLSVMLPPHILEGGIDRAVNILKDPMEREKIKQEILNPTYTWDNFHKNCGGFDGVFIIEASIDKDAQGKTISQYAKEQGKNEFDTLFDMYVRNHGEITAVYHMMSEYDVRKILSFSNTTIGTDGISFTEGVPAHPRGFGSFTRIISKYVKEDKLMTLEEAVYKMTGLPAKTLNLSNKGFVREGYDADITILNYDKISDNATYTNSSALSGGIKYVIVNGEIAYFNKKLTNTFAGKVF